MRVWTGFVHLHFGKFWVVVLNSSAFDLGKLDKVTESLHVIVHDYSGGNIGVSCVQPRFAAKIQAHLCTDGVRSYLCGVRDNSEVTLGVSHVM